MIFLCINYYLRLFIIFLDIGDLDVQFNDGTDKSYNCYYCYFNYNVVEGEGMLDWLE